MCQSIEYQEWEGVKLGSQFCNDKSHHGNYFNFAYSALAVLIEMREKLKTTLPSQLPLSHQRRTSQFKSLPPQCPLARMGEG